MKPPSDLRDLAFLDGEIMVGSIRLRPLSIMSLALSDAFDLSIVRTGGRVEGLTPEELDRQVKLFFWMQSAPVAVVKAAARSGDWLEIPAAVDTGDASLDLAALVLIELRHYAALIEASAFRAVGGKPGSARAFPPSWIARKLCLVSQGIQASADFILWELPFSIAHQVEHFVLRNAGWKTVRVSDAASAEESEKEIAAAAQAAAAVASPPDAPTW